ncbi:MAG: purine-binding chemotaxis protein CheW [Candidatus Hydrogenedentes bacterium]|nr:purine-binding chemotaxis protein CheW [Candidatus Hydrogenedentota bacterium]
MQDLATEARNTAASAALDTLAGKYLTFELDNEVYGLGILKVQEIIGMMNVTRVPKTPDYVRGVINLRGKVIPVIDLRLKFGMSAEQDTERTCIIVVQIAHAGSVLTTGLIVDQVSEVLNINADQIEAPPAFGSSLDTDFIMAMGKVGQKVIMLLNADKILGSGELALASQLAQ